MSDERKPNSYEPLKQTERDVEAKNAAEARQIGDAERHEQFVAKYTEYLTEQAEAKKIPGREVTYNLSRIENDPAFLQDAEKKVADWEASKAEAEKAEAGKTESAKDKSPVEMTDARSVRMQRLREITEGLDRENQEREGNEGPTRDDSGHGR